VLLLDTHAWIWTVHGDARRIGRRSRRLLSRAASREALRLSVVTIFEVTALHTLGRIRLTRPLEEWIRESCRAAGVRIAELSSAMAIDAGAIPRSALADPIDRLLVATARQLDAVFLTSDASILDYAEATGAVHVHDTSL
jgi:PIN domain nuclease of toxin-antitoxin system